MKFFVQKKEYLKPLSEEILSSEKSLEELESGLDKLEFQFTNTTGPKLFCKIRKRIIRKKQKQLLEERERKAADLLQKYKKWASATECAFPYLCKIETANEVCLYAYDLREQVRKFESDMEFFDQFRNERAECGYQAATNSLERFLDRDAIRFSSLPDFADMKLDPADYLESKKRTELCIPVI